MLNLAAEADIYISPDRQRRAFDEDAIGKLSMSIATKGLLHPIVVRAVDGKLQLVAGERRMRAIKMNHLLSIPFNCNGAPVPHGQFPYITVTDLDVYQLEEAELEENILREDLTWQERASATARLHKLREEQSGEKQTITATASEILGKQARGQQLTETRDDIILAEHLADPDVQKAGSKKDAMKIVRRKAEAAHRAKLAEDFQQTDAKTRHQLFHNNAVEFMQGLEAESIQVILTDPPYMVGANTFGSQVATAHNYEDSGEDFWPTFCEFARESFRVAAREAHLYCFCDVRMFGKQADELRRNGWDVFATPLIWFKSNGIGIIPRPEHGPRRTYECILYAIKGGRKTQFCGNDVLAIPADVEREHGAQKPVALYSELLSRSVNPGDTVADFFCGSGPIFPAADLHNCKAIGVEKVKANYDIALQRLLAVEQSATGPAHD